MKKVLFLNRCDDPINGGTETMLHHLTQGLARRGVEPVILSTSATPGLRQTEREGIRIWRAGLHNIYWPGKTQRGTVARMLWHMLDSYNPAMQPNLRRVLKVERPDVVSIHNLPGWSAASWRTIADMGIPSVQVLHDSYAICPKSTMFKGNRNCIRQCTSCRALRLPHRRLSNNVSAIVGVSSFILNLHLEQGYFHEVPIRQVIHDARDPDELGVNTSASKYAPERPVRVGFIGRLDPTKGVMRLLETITQLDIPGAELWIAGSGKADFEQILRRRFASSPVRFLGWVVPCDFYPEVDIVVIPSLWHEPLGMVVVEAFAFGKPVIGSRRGGIPEMIRDGENGLLFEPDQPGELAAALQRLAGNIALRARMGEAARDSARPFLNCVAWVSRYLGLYAEVIGKPLRSATA